MTKKLVPLCSCAVALALFAPGRAEAVIGTPDNVPAATLLLPYFEVDLGNPLGVSTLFSINNASATAILAHVTLWTDLGVPTIVLNVYLTGYDVQTINVRDILIGNLPPTASDGQDPQDTISPQGDFSQDINFASCNGQLPPAALSAAVIAELQAAHRGLAAATLFGGNCGGRNLGDNVARGYITVDTVNNCTLRKPNEVGYFLPGQSGDVTNQNTLWGDYFFLDPTNNFAQGDSLVHIEASATNPDTSVAGQYTFYGRYVGWNASDNREPLGTTFAARFASGGAFSGGTRIVVWRDSKVNQASFACASPPAALGQEDLYAFTEQEEAEKPAPATPFPAASNRVVVDGASLPVTPDFGWLYINLNHSGGGGNPTEDPAAAQAWVSNVMDASGRFSVGQPGVMLRSARSTTHTCINGTGPAPPCP